jgi:hypothetical protein
MDTDKKYWYQTLKVLSHSLIGVNMTSKTHINWEVSAKGFLFAFPNAKEESVPVKNWQLLSLSKADTVVVQILTQLIDEEKAEETEYSVLLPHTIVANLPGDERNSLFFSEPFPFEIEIRSSGALADSNFRYVYRFLNGRSQPFVHPTRIGCYLEITHEQTYIIAGEQYHLIEALDAFNNRSTADKTIKDNLLEFAKIKGLAQETGSTLDAYLNRENVIAPSRLSLRLKRVDDDTIEIEPLLCEEIVDEDGNASLKAILDDDQQSSFLKTFDIWNEERELYPVPDGPRIVFDAKQKEGLGQIKQHRRVSGKEKEIMLQNPQEFFDPDVINLDSFSERVIEIGEYRPRCFPFLRPNRESWLPPEGGIIIDGTMVHIPPDEARSFIECVKKAIQVGKKEILWKGQPVPATGETLKAAEQLVEIRPLTDTSSKEAVENSRKSDGGKNVLIIKDNLDQTNYRPGRLSHPGKPDLPRALKPEIKLFPHQREGIAWLQKLWIDGAKGALLADDMGLGKTLQTLTFMAWVREMDGGKFSPQPMLVVAPVALLEVWKKEYSKFLDPIFGPFLEMHGSNLNKYKDKFLAKSLNIKKEVEIKDKDDAESIIRSGRGMLLDVKQIRRAGAVITTYETLRDYQFSLGVINWRVMVMDETQKIKNPTAMVTTAAKAMKYEFGITLTGTPVENSWVDLWSIMDFVQPGRLGNLKEFVSNYQNPLKKEETDREALGRSLKKEVTSNMLRRMKEDHLKGLPEKKVEIYPVNMPDVQLNRYLEIVQKAKETLPDQINGGRKQHIFTTIAALRDISLHPYLPFYSEQSMTNFSDDELINSSARLWKTIEILKEIQRKDEKVIVFVISRKMQRILQRIIKNRFKIHAHIVNGEIPGSRRNGLVDAFQTTTGFNIIIMSPEAAGVGLNVEKANHVIHLSRAWNPAKEDQATDRVYRIGQERPVTVHIPLAVHPMFDNKECRGTFDRKLGRLLEYKRQLSRSVLLPPVVSGNEWTTMGEEILEARVKGEKTSGLSLYDIDRMFPEVFEKAVGALYRKMGEYQVTVTPQNKDFGADVVVLAHGEEKDSFLIQCKHTIDPDRLQSQNGVQEILAATGVYSQDYKINFQTVVVTNAKGFTGQTVQVASANKVNLLCRKELKELLIKYQVSFGDIH